MDKLDEIVTIDGVQYTQRELDVLREFCSRDTLGPSSTNKLKSFLGMRDAGNIDINTFLATGSIPDSITDTKTLQSFLSKIETLYSIACKYGASHKFPQTPLYREEEFYQKIVGNYDYRSDFPRKREYVTEAFKSFSKSRGESEAFSKGEFSSHKLVLHDSSKQKIPFIDVNRLLGTDNLQASESEILLPPFQKFLVDLDASIIPRDPRRVNSPVNDFGMTATNEMRNPYIVSNHKSDGKDIVTYNPELHDVSDAELEQLVQFSKKDNLTPLEKEAQKKLQNKLRLYTMTRCKSIFKMQMEHPLVIGKNASKEAISNYGFAVYKDPPPGYIFTKEDLSKRRSIGYELDTLMVNMRVDYETIKQITPYDFSNGISDNMIHKFLDVGHKTGNKEAVKSLASKGLTIDEVLVFNGQITPVGKRNLSHIYPYHIDSTEPVLLAEERKKAQLSDSYLLNIYEPSLSYLLEKGFSLLEDDPSPSEIAKKSLDKLSKTACTSFIRTASTGFNKCIDTKKYNPKTTNKGRQ